MPRVVFVPPLVLIGLLISGCGQAPAPTSAPTTDQDRRAYIGQVLTAQEIRDARSTEGLFAASDDEDCLETKVIEAYRMDLASIAPPAELQDLHQELIGFTKEAQTTEDAANDSRLIAWSEQLLNVSAQYDFDKAEAERDKLPAKEAGAEGETKRIAALKWLVASGCPGVRQAAEEALSYEDH